MTDRHEIIRMIWDGESKVTAISLLAFLLLILSIPYRFAVIVRNFLYDQGMLRTKKLPCPVISIGNLTVGGTGKTPLAILLAGMLKENGFRPAVLSRGYGRREGKSSGVVSDGSRLLMDHRQAGDEPFLMSLLLPQIPVIVGADRFLTGKMAIEQLGADILILDDGFQHRGLYRDIDIVLLPAPIARPGESSRPLGNGRLLPGGSLREPPGSLRRADIIVITGSGNQAGSSLPDCWEPLLKGSTPRFQSFHRARAIIDTNGEARPLTFLQGKRIYAFSGIGNPRSFRRTIECLGANLSGFDAFPDHHHYDAAEIAGITAHARLSQSDIILTTEKDGVRLLEFPDFRANIFLLRIEMAFIPDGDGFLTQILDNLPAPIARPRKTANTE
jgi:tetraacyldisaccharide 4'-kinase